MSITGFDKLVSQLILGNLATDFDTIESDTLLSELNMGSLEKLSLAVNLEESCDLEIPDKEIDEFKSIGDVVDCLERATVLKQKKRLSKRLNRARVSAGLNINAENVTKIKTPATLGASEAGQLKILTSH